MKTLKAWRGILLVAAALSLGTASCSDDHDDRPATSTEQAKQADEKLQGKWFLDRSEVIARDYQGDPVIEYSRRQSGYIYTFKNGRYTIQHLDARTGKNTLTSNGTYTLTVNASTGDTRLELYRYTENDEKQTELDDYYTVYELTKSAMELRKQLTGMETILSFTPYK